MVIAAPPVTPRRRCSLSLLQTDRAPDRARTFSAVQLSRTDDSRLDVCTRTVGSSSRRHEMKGGRKGNRTRLASVSNFPAHRSRDDQMPGFWQWCPLARPTHAHVAMDSPLTATAVRDEMIDRFERVERRCDAI